MVPRENRLAAFTLVELLTVIAIIAILAGLLLAAGSGIMKKAARSRASAEIQAMSTALEAYKTDNGIYPVGNTTASSGSSLTGPPTGSYPGDPVVANIAAYQTASEALYQALSGQTYYSAAPTAGVKSYMSFKLSQIGSPTGPLSYIKDPWTNPYGYSTGNTTQTLYPYNGSGFFDLWSTGGTTAGNTAIWLTNWQ